jgi:hypothetical protein
VNLGLVMARHRDKKKDSSRKSGGARDDPTCSKSIEEWRRWLTGEANASPKALSGDDARRAKQLEVLWQAVTACHEYPPLFLRDLQAQTSLPPLALLFLHVGFGLYPPPELLLTLNDAFDKYMDGCGKVDLESVFFGNLKTRVGNYAGRRFARGEKAKRTAHALVAADGATGKKLHYAAESVIDRFDLKGKKGKPMDAENLVKDVRKFRKENPRVKIT